MIGIPAILRNIALNHSSVHSRFVIDKMKFIFPIQSIIFIEYNERI